MVQNANSVSQNTDYTGPVICRKFPNFFLLQFQNSYASSVENDLVLANLLRNILQEPQNVILDLYLLDDIETPTLDYLFLFSMIRSQKKVYTLYTALEETVKSKLQHKFNDLLHHTENFSGALKVLDKALESIELPNVMKSIYYTLVEEFYLFDLIFLERGKTHFRPDTKNSFSGPVTFVNKVIAAEFEFQLSMSLGNELAEHLVKKCKDKANKKGESVENESGRDMLVPIFNQVTENIKSLVKQKTSSIQIDFQGIWDKDFYPKFEIFSFDFADTRTLIIPFKATYGELFMELSFPKKYEIKEITKILND